MSKIMFRYFTVADYEKEELWLRKQHNNGFKMVKFIFPCFYVFERCEPEDVIYRLDFNNEKTSDDYIQLTKDFGWEHFCTVNGFYYLRKSAAGTPSKEEGELFSDNASKKELAEKVIQGRLIPAVCCLFVAAGSLFIAYKHGSLVLKIILAALIFMLAFSVVNCFVKLKRLKDKYKNK